MYFHTRLASYEVKEFLSKSRLQLNFALCVISNYQVHKFTYL